MHNYTCAYLILRFPRSLHQLFSSLSLPANKHIVLPVLPKRRNIFLSFFSNFLRGHFSPASAIHVSPACARFLLIFRHALPALVLFLFFVFIIVFICLIYLVA